MALNYIKSMILYSLIHILPPDIGKLKKIIMHINGRGIDDIKYCNYEDIIKNHKLFSNIRDRINKIYVDDKTHNIIISL